MLIHLKTEDNYKKVEELFNQIREESKPKIVSWGELKKLGETHLLNTFHSSINYGKSLAKYADSEPWVEEPLDSINHKKSIEEGRQPTKNFHARLENSIDNVFFHASKCRWLIDEWKENGWYSYPQACVQPNGQLWFHPGSIRQYALHAGHMDSQNIVLWDCWIEKELMPHKPIITFEQWRNIFTVDRSQWIDAVGFPDESGTQKLSMSHMPILEWHVDEDRPKYYETAYRIQKEMFNFKKPKLIGECEDSVKDCFEDNTECLEIHMKEGIFYEPMFLSLFSWPFDKKEWECREFFIRKTF